MTVVHDADQYKTPNKGANIIKANWTWHIFSYLCCFEPPVKSKNARHPDTHTRTIHTLIVDTTSFYDKNSRKGFEIQRKIQRPLSQVLELWHPVLGRIGVHAAETKPHSLRWNTKHRWSSPQIRIVAFHSDELGKFQQIRRKMEEHLAKKCTWSLTLRERGRTLIQTSRLSWDTGIWWEFCNACSGCFQIQLKSEIARSDWPTLRPEQLTSLSHI